MAHVTLPEQSGAARAVCSWGWRCKFGKFLWNSISWVKRDPWGSSSATPGSTQYHPKFKPHVESIIPGSLFCAHHTLCRIVFLMLSSPWNPSAQRVSESPNGHICLYNQDQIGTLVGEGNVSSVHTSIYIIFVNLRCKLFVESQLHPL